MREVKFRAWDGEQMYYAKFCEYLSEYACSFPYTTTPKNIMQYTGLKDKNGVEVYEGDVVNAVLWAGSHNEEHLGHIVFSEFEYCIETTDDTWPIASWKNVTECEVIGNIYENGDLLND